jgi:hypothetical protein
MEVVPLLNNLHRALACPATRAQLGRGGMIRMRDAVRGHFADLRLAPLQDLIQVLEALVPALIPSPERPEPPYQSAIIDNAIAARAFPSPQEAK